MKERQYNRPERRELATINRYFDKLVDEYKYARATHSKWRLQELVTKLNEKWQSYVRRHLRKQHVLIRPNINAFIDQVHHYEKLAKANAEALKRERLKKDYDTWLTKMEIYKPKLLRRMRFTNRVLNLPRKKKIDYVKKKFEKVQGKSPTGSWL